MLIIGEDEKWYITGDLAILFLSQLKMAKITWNEGWGVFFVVVVCEAEL